MVGEGTGKLGGKVISEFRKNSGWLLVLGVVLLALGAVGLYMRVSIPESGVQWVGALLILGGLIQLVDVFKSDKWVSRLSHMVTSGLYVAVGLVMIVFTDESSTLLILLVGFGLLIIGVLRVLIALQGRKHLKLWVGVLISGLVGVAMGVMLMAQWPWPGNEVLALFVCIELVLQGMAMIYIAIAVKSGAAHG